MPEDNSRDLEDIFEELEGEGTPIDDQETPRAVYSDPNRVFVPETVSRGSGTRTRQRRPSRREVERTHTPEEYQARTESINNKIEEMLEDIIPSIKRETTRLLASGGVDRWEYEDNYVLPKILLIAALKNVSESIGLPSGNNIRRDIRNLSHF